MIDYKMFPAIFDKIWDGIDNGLIKMDIWASLSAQERHEVNKMTEGDKGEEGKAAVWRTVQQLYRRVLVDYPEVSKAYIKIRRCPSCDYDTEDTTVAVEVPYYVGMMEQMAKLDLDINIAIRPYCFDCEYIDEDDDIDLSEWECFYRKSQRRLDISDTLSKVNELLRDGKTMSEVSQSIGFTRQSIFDWMNKDWLCFTREEYKAHREKLRLKENRRRMKIASRMFAKGHSKSQVCRMVRVGYDTMNSWIALGLVTVTPVREQQYEQMVGMALRGEKQADIAKHFGMGQTTVSERLRRSEKYIEYKEEKNRGKYKLARQLAAQGLSQKDIAKSLRLSRSQTCRILKKETDKNEAKSNSK